MSLLTVVRLPPPSLLSPIPPIISSTMTVATPRPQRITTTNRRRTDAPPRSFRPFLHTTLRLPTLSTLAPRLVVGGTKPSSPHPRRPPPLSLEALTTILLLTLIRLRFLKSSMRRRFHLGLTRWSAPSRSSLSLISTTRISHSTRPCLGRREKDRPKRRIWSSSSA